MLNAMNKEMSAITTPMMYPATTSLTKCRLDRTREWPTPAAAINKKMESGMFWMARVSMVASKLARMVCQLGNVDAWILPEKVLYNSLIGRSLK